MDNRKQFPKIKGTYLELLPIKQNNEIHKFIGSNANKIILAKKNDNSADTSALEAEIDQMVYELYDLTEEEIKIVEESVK